MACHLELDKDAGTVYIFRYPSFCASKILDPRSVIHACSSEDTGNSHWATAQDVTELMQEILLSHKLLFGQRCEI